MKTGRHILLAAGLALTLPFGLTACSDDTSESGKPSRQDVYDGWSGMMDEDLAKEGMTPEALEQAGFTRRDMEEFHSCVVDSIYDDMSAESLQKLADQARTEPLPTADNDLLDDELSRCMGRLGL